MNLFDRFLSTENKKTAFLVIVVNFLCYAISFGQASVKGIVRDSKDSIIVGASVLIMKSIDSTLVKGGVTSQSGLFVFDNILPGGYFIQIQMVGFKRAYLSEFDIRSLSDAKDFGFLTLEEEVNTLTEVSVKKEKVFVEQLGDRLLINLDGKSTSKGGTVLDLLQVMPGVSTSKQNNAIFLNGKEGVLIMINGRPTRLPMTAIFEMLNGMSPDQVDKIELISIPPVKYAAEGSAGIINIMTKGYKNEGKSVSINLSTGYGAGFKGAGGVAGNAKIGRVDLFGEYSYSYNDTYQYFTNRRVVKVADIETGIFNQSRREPSISNQNFRGGMDYAMSSKITLGGVMSGYRNKWKMGAENETDVVSSIPDSSRHIRTLTQETNLWGHFMGSVYGDYKINDQEKLSISSDYLYYKNDNPTDYNILHAWKPDGDIFLDQKLNVKKNTPINMWVWQIDYAKIIGKKMRMEIGVNSAFARLSNDVNVQDNNKGSWEANSALSEKYSLNEHIQAIYGSLNVNIKGGKIVAGIRYEHTDTELSTASKTGMVDRNFGNFFPNFSISKEINSDNILQFSYGRRIARPSYTDLAPFIIYFDPYTLSTGNIRLKSAITDAVNVDYSYKQNLFSFRYSYDNNAISRFQPQNIENTNQQLNASINLKYKRIYSLSASVPVSVTNFWEIQNSLVGSYQEIETSHLNRPVLLRQYSFRYSLNNSIKLSKGFSVEISGFYQSPFILGVSRQKSLSTINLGFSKIIGKGSLGFSYSDPFRKNYDREFVFMPEHNLDIDISYKYEFRVVKLTYSYVFGKSNRSNRGSSSENMRKRLE